MRKWAFLTITGVLLCASVAAQEQRHIKKDIQNAVVDTAVSAGSFKTLVTAVKADLPCKNGVIHVIDSVILPREQVQTLEYFPFYVKKPYHYRKTVKSLLRSKTGVLKRRPVSSKSRLLIKDSEGEYQDYVLKGKSLAMAGQSMTKQGFTQSYEPPLTLFPAVLEKQRVYHFASIVKHRDRDGTDTGAITRTVEWMGTETIKTPAGTFKDCLKLRVRSHNRPDIAKNFLASTEETVWLAKGIGEVKSESRVRLKVVGLPFMDARVTLELTHFGASKNDPGNDQGKDAGARHSESAKSHKAVSRVLY